jgi:hypothetical protein
MRRLIWPLVVFIICLPVALLATGVPIPFFDRPAALPNPLSVPEGDQEIAWLHTTTNATTWERFVSGMVRCQLLVPGLHVDVAAAFSEQTTGVPEIVVSMDGRPGKLRIRWYKLSSDTTAAYWVRALATRSHPPLAVIGGGSSDRALDLARALQTQQNWPGSRPLLFLTTATADTVRSDQGMDDEEALLVNLIEVYRDRTFRFCFTNRQMAESVLEFVWGHPRLRPGPLLDGVGAVASSPATARQPVTIPDDNQPDVLGIVWNDDPFSRDLHERFGDAVRGKAAVETWEVPYSVGGFYGPNFYESRVAESIIDRYRSLSNRRTLLVLSTVTQPARRILRAITEADPAVRDRLVAVTGDGIPVNAVYRDGAFAWPVHSLPVPLVLFTHHHPADWDEEGQESILPPGYDLRPPNSTEDVKLFTELTRIVVEACYPPGSTALASDAEELARRLRSRTPAYFDDRGNRLGGSGEHVVVLWPQTVGSATDAILEVFRRGRFGEWESVRSVPVIQRRSGSGARLAGNGGSRAGRGRRSGG